MNNLSDKSMLLSPQIGIVSLGTKAAGFIAVTLLVASCAIAVKQARPDAEVVKERAQARWDAMVKGDFRTGYQFVSPAGKSVISETQYDASYKRGFWTGANVERVDCTTPELCEVDLRIAYKLGAAEMKAPLREKWVKQDSQWWFVLER
jgi:uncharacterized protein YchJ